MSLVYSFFDFPPTPILFVFLKLNSEALKVHCVAVFIATFVGIDMEISANVDPCFAPIVSRTQS